MTRRLGKFMEEIEHYDPQIGYRPGRLQTVPDALSRIPGQREEGEPASAERFMELGEGEGEEEGDENREHDDVDERARDEISDTQDVDGGSGAPATPAPSMRPKIGHDTRYYENIRRYLRAKSIEKEVDEKIKKDAEMYALKEGALFDKDTGIRVVMELELFEEIVEAIHKDLGHYGKKTTLDAVADRYIMAPRNSTPTCLVNSTNLPPRLRRSSMRRFIHTAKSAPSNSGSWITLELSLRR
jgi:hypothetical protein